MKTHFMYLVYRKSVVTKNSIGCTIYVKQYWQWNSLQICTNFLKSLLVKNGNNILPGALEWSLSVPCPCFVEFLVVNSFFWSSNPMSLFGPACSLLPSAVSQLCSPASYCLRAPTFFLNVTHFRVMALHLNKIVTLLFCSFT